VKIYVAVVEAALRKNERQDETQFITRIGLKGKLVWVLVISFCEKISFPVTCLMPYYAQAKLAVLIT
jgi:hypothetical protein